MVEHEAQNEKSGGKLCKAYLKYFQSVCTDLDTLCTGQLPVSLCYAVLRADVRSELQAHLQNVVNPGHDSDGNGQDTIAIDDLQSFFAARQRDSRAATSLKEFQCLFLVNSAASDGVVMDDIGSEHHGHSRNKMLSYAVAVRHLQPIDPWEIIKASTCTKRKPRPEWQKCVEKLVSTGRVTLRGLKLPDIESDEGLCDWDDLSSAATQQHVVRIRVVKLPALKSMTSYQDIAGLGISSGTRGMLVYVDIDGNSQQSTSEDRRTEAGNQASEMADGHDGIDGDASELSAGENLHIPTCKEAFEARESRLASMRACPDVQRELERWWQVFGVTLTSSQLATANQKKDLAGNATIASYSMSRKTSHLAKLLREESSLREQREEIVAYREYAAEQERKRRTRIYTQLNIDTGDVSEGPSSEPKGHDGALMPAALRKSVKLQDQMTRFKLLLPEHEGDVSECLAEGMSVSDVGSEVSMATSNTNTNALLRTRRKAVRKDFSGQSKLLERLDAISIRAIDRRITDALLGGRLRKLSSLVNRSTAVDFLEQLRISQTDNGDGGGGVTCHTKANMKQNQGDVTCDTKGNVQGRTDQTAALARQWLSKREWLGSILDIADFWTNTSEPAEYTLFLKSLLAVVQSGPNFKRVLQAQAVDRLVIAKRSKAVNKSKAAADTEKGETLKPVARWPQTMGDVSTRPQAWSFGKKHVRSSKPVTLIRPRRTAIRPGPRATLANDHTSDITNTSDKKAHTEARTEYPKLPSDFFTTRLSYESRVDGNRLPGGRESRSVVTGYLRAGVPVRALGVVPYFPDHTIRPREQGAAVQRESPEVRDARAELQSRLRIREQTLRCIREYMKGCSNSRRSVYGQKRRSRFSCIPETHCEEDSEVCKEELSEAQDVTKVESDDRELRDGWSGNGCVSGNQSDDQREQEQAATEDLNAELIRAELQRHLELLEVASSERIMQISENQTLQPDKVLNKIRRTFSGSHPGKSKLRNTADGRTEVRGIVVSAEDQLRAVIANCSTVVNQSAVSEQVPWWNRDRSVVVGGRKSLAKTGSRQVRPSTAHAVLSGRVRVRDNKIERTERRTDHRHEMATSRRPNECGDDQPRRRPRGDSRPLMRRRPSTAGPLARPAIQAVRGYVEQPRQWSASRLGRK